MCNACLAAKSRVGLKPIGGGRGRREIMKIIDTTNLFVTEGNEIRNLELIQVQLSLHTKGNCPLAGIGRVEGRQYQA